MNKEKHQTYIYVNEDCRMESIVKDVIGWLKEVEERVVVKLKNVIEYVNLSGLSITSLFNFNITSVLEIKQFLIDYDISLIKRFVVEYPNLYLNIEKEEFYRIIDKARPDNLWKKKPTNWELQSLIWNEH